MRRAFTALTTQLLAFTFTAASVVPTTASAAGPIACAQLAADPAAGLAGNPLIKSAVSNKVTVSGVSYCQVDLLYGRTADENINIRVGLPFNSVDGGSGGVRCAQFAIAEHQQLWIQF